MTTNEIRTKFLDFFKKRDHVIIPSASLVTTDEKGVTDSTLFNTAGMQPLVPYIMGQVHPDGKRLADAQKCIRTIDIDEVGDNTHATFFEMLGNWSLGDYFKEDAIKWSYDLLTNKEEGFGLDPDRLYVTVFKGNDDAPIDNDAAEIWKKYIPENRIYFLEDNWWAAGDNGPCGPDTEMFYDLTDKGLGDLSHDEFLAADEKQELVEIWNNVFMAYEKKDGKVVGELADKSVDTGSGLERVAAVLQNKNNIFEIDAFKPLLDIAETFTEETSSARIIADHLKASIFMIGDGVLPSNTDRGYILRRLLRRAMTKITNVELTKEIFTPIIDTTIKMYGQHYVELSNKKDSIISIIQSETEKFQKTLRSGMKEFNKLSLDKNISGEEAFILFSTYGFPLELTEELAQKGGVSVDTESFKQKFKEHQSTSQTAAAGKFKGGLAGTSEMEIKYHTATHLLHSALREVLGTHVEQKGSNITPDRLRFDFSHSEKMTDEEKSRVTDMVNAKISDALPVTQKDMNITDAQNEGAIGLFADKYGDIVSTYTIGDGPSKFSMELCGGPHVENTETLGTFRIKKEEASSAGIRRIKAILE